MDRVIKHKVGSLVVGLALSAGAFGGSGPGIIGGGHSSEWGPYFYWDFANKASANTAVSVGMRFGSDVFNFGGSIAWRFQPEYVYKLTLMHLANDVKFNFSDRPTKEWIGQEMVSMALKGPVHWHNFNWEAKGYIGRARDENYGSQRFGSGRLYRESTGALLAGGRLNLFRSFEEWGDGRIGVSYDSVRYNMENEAPRNEYGPGFLIGYKKSFRGKSHIGLSAEWRAPYDQYTAEFSYELLQKPASHLDVTLKDSYIKVELPYDNDNQISAQLSYYWGANTKDKNGVSKNQEDWDLTNYAIEPAVFIPEVFTLRDQVQR